MFRIICIQTVVGLHMQTTCAYCKHLWNLCHHLWYIGILFLAILRHCFVSLYVRDFYGQKMPIDNYVELGIYYKQKQVFQTLPCTISLHYFFKSIEINTINHNYFGVKEKGRKNATADFIIYWGGTPKNCFEINQNTSCTGTYALQQQHKSDGFETAFDYIISLDNVGEF